MTDRIRIDMACNDGDNGNFAGRVCQIALPGGMLELTAKAWNITSFRGCPKLTLTKRGIMFSGKCWDVISIREWVGNWCWNGFWFQDRVALDFLVWLHRRALFDSEAGWCDFIEIWERPAPLKLDEGWRVHLVEESRRG